MLSKLNRIINALEMNIKTFLLAAILTIFSTTLYAHMGATGIVKDDHIEQSVSAKTFIRYEEICSKLLIPALGKIELQKLHSLQIQAYYKIALESGRLKGEGGLSAKTVKHHHHVLSGAMKKAVKWRLINVNPCDAG